MRQVRFWRRDVCGAEEAVLCICPGKDCSCFFWELAVPFPGKHADDRQRASSTQPVLGDLLKVLHTVDDVALGVLLGQVQEVDSTGRMHNVDGNVAYLPQAIGPFVDAHQLGDR